MAKLMLIDSTHAEETRVVVMNGTRLEDFDVETSTKKQLKGNIYLAKIVRVEPSLQAAFVDYGGNRHGFLAFSEIHPDYYQIPVADRQALLAEQREVMRQSSTAASADFGDGDEFSDGPIASEDAQPTVVSSEEILVEANGEISVRDETALDVSTTDGEGENEEAPPPRRKSLRNYKIQEVIKRRQIVLIQVVKEERGNKGAALTTYLSLAGRYCVLMPNTARGGGVSRKITNATDRKRLKTIANEMNIPNGMAVIVRTAGSERTKPEIRRDYEYLLRLWDSVRDLTLKSTAPALVYEEANLIKRSIRDLYSRDIDEIQVDGEEGYRLAKDFMRMLTPSHARRVQLYKDPAMPLFQKFQVEAQLDAMHSPVVQLRSGGYIVINQTEALVAIDVNSGRATKERHIEETALKTNCEAADEISRQLRLRDLAGLIVIDFIDMEDTRNHHTVERRLKDGLRFDRARIQVGKISTFGLLELSRQRLRPSLMESTFQPCIHCSGTGVVRSVESASMYVLRAIEEEGIRRRSSEVTVAVASSIALYILNHKRDALADIEARYGFRVFLLGDDSLIVPNYRMDRVKSDIPIEIPVYRPINSDQGIVEEVEEDEVEEVAVAEAVVEPKAAVVAEVSGETEDENTRRRRRRRRRRGRRDESGNLVSADGEGEAEAEAEGESLGQGAVEGAEADDAEDEGEDEEVTLDNEGNPITVADGEPAARRRRRGKRGGRRRNRGRDGLILSVGEDGGVAASEGDNEEGEAATDVPVEVSFVPAADLPPVEDVAIVVETIEAVPSEDAPKPKRTRAPRKKAVVAAEADAVPSAETAEAPKPKRPRAPRKKAVVVEEAAPAVDATPAISESVVVESTLQDAASITPPSQDRGEPMDSVIVELPVQVETTSEPAVVTAEPHPEQNEPAAPPRRGWWNRLL